MIFLVLEAHRALHFRRGIDKSSQRIAGQRMIVPACVDVFELQAFVIMALRIGALEQESFNLVGGIEGVPLLLVQFFSVVFQDAANVAGVGGASLVDDLAEDQHLARAKHVGGCPIKGGPVDA